MGDTLLDQKTISTLLDGGWKRTDLVQIHESKSEDLYTEHVNGSQHVPEPIALPAPRPKQSYVKVSALDAGYITLPERDFVTGADPHKRTTVPSMSFLLQHGITNVLFDLGLKKNLSDYPPHFKSHLESRQPITVDPDVVGSLALGGLTPSDIDAVILSHVHYDHAGSPSNFPSSSFVVGHGTHNLIHNGIPGHRISLFDPTLLPEDRTIELPSPASTPSKSSLLSIIKDSVPINIEWKPLAHLPNTIDFFGDGSLYIVDSPGHTPGHLNVLARTGPKSWVYLAGDSAHDMRLLTGEKEIGTWKTPDGHCHCIHLDREEAARTIARIGRLLQPSPNGSRVEIILAHDAAWDSANRDKFFPNHIEG